MDHSRLIAIIIILLVLGSWLWRYRIKPYFASNELDQQFKRHKDWKRIKKTECFLISLYQSVNSTHVSLNERKRLNIEDDAFIYGEVEFLSFFGILETVDPKPGEVFYDLGSGAGKAVMTAALYFDFSKVCGIELLPGLTDLANEQLKKARQLIATNKTDLYRSWMQRLSAVQYINNDFLNCDISDGDIVFINATCLSYPTWEAIVEKLKGLKPGSKIIVLSKKIKLDAFTLVRESRELMSWGMNSVNIYKKNA